MLLVFVDKLLKLGTNYILCVVLLLFLKLKPRFTVQTDACRNCVLYNSKYGFRLRCRWANRHDVGV